MLDTPRARILAVALVLLGQLSLFPLHARQPTNPEAGVFPNEHDFIESPDRYLGQRVVAGGVVQRTSPLVIRVAAGQGTHHVTIVGSTLSPTPGDRVRVFGRLRGPRTIRASTAFVVPARGLWYAWSVSFIAGLWVLFRLLRQWTVDRSTLSVRPRETAVSVRDALRRVRSPWGEDDA